MLYRKFYKKYLPYGENFVQLLQIAYSFSIKKNSIKFTSSICTNFNVRTSFSTSPKIQEYLLKPPLDINEMPVDKSEVKRNSFCWCCIWLEKVTHSQINSSNQYVESMKSGCKVKRTSINRITKCKCSSCIF